MTFDSGKRDIRGRLASVEALPFPAKRPSQLSGHLKPDLFPLRLREVDHLGSAGLGNGIRSRMELFRLRLIQDIFVIG